MCAALLWYLRDIFLIVLSAIVIASALEPGITFLVKRGLHRLLSVILLYVSISVAFSGTLFFFVPLVLTDASNFLQNLPATLAQINLTDLTHGLIPAGTGSDALSSAGLLSNLSNTITDTTGGVFTTASAFFGGLTSFLLIVVFSFYFSVQETGVDDFLSIVTPARHEEYVLGLWKRSQDKIGKWMYGQLILGVLVAAFLFPCLTLMGIPHALLLSLLAGVFELIPVFGQIIAMVPAVVIGFTTGGATGALLVAGLYVVVQQFEAHLIYPLVVKKVVGIPPIVVILALLFGFKLVGFLGVLLSVPIASAIQEYVSDVVRAKKRAVAHHHLAGGPQAQ